MKGKNLEFICVVGDSIPDVLMKATLDVRDLVENQEFTIVSSQIWNCLLPSPMLGLPPKMGTGILLTLDIQKIDMPA